MEGHSCVQYEHCLLSTKTTGNPNHEVISNYAASLTLRGLLPPAFDASTRGVGPHQPVASAPPPKLTPNRLFDRILGSVLATPWFLLHANAS